MRNKARAIQREHTTGREEEEKRKGRGREEEGKRKRRGREEEGKRKRRGREEVLMDAQETPMISVLCCIPTAAKPFKRVMMAANQPRKYSYCLHCAF
jgi:hypothetical protein